MFNFRKLLPFVLSMNLLATSSMQADGSIKEKERVSLAKEDLSTQLLRSRCSIEKERHSLELNDFSGPWIFHILSVGGIAGSDAVGLSQIIDGQIILNHKGKGVVQAGFISAYGGTPGEVLNIDFSKQAKLEINIIDPEAGVIEVVLKSPDLFHYRPDIIATEKFILTTIRSKKGGRVIKLQGHRTEVSPSSATNLYSFYAERQYQ